MAGDSVDATGGSVDVIAIVASVVEASRDAPGDATRVVVAPSWTLGDSDEEGISTEGPGMAAAGLALIASQWVGLRWY